MTRQHGVVGSAAGLVPFGHLGWGYRDRAEFGARAAEYIADGLAQRQWVEYVGEGSHEKLRAELATLPGIADHAGIKATPVWEFYAVPTGTDIINLDTALAARVAGVEAALEHGYTGFRAVIDVTTLARRPEQRDAHACFEFRIDEKMAVLPVSALCAYDLAQLGDDAGELICLHPFVNHPGPMFRLYAQPDAAFALSGQLDATNNAAFTTALHRIWPLAAAESRVDIDARSLEGISDQQLATLDRYASADGRQVVLHTGHHIPTRLAGSLRLANIRITPPDEDTEVRPSHDASNSAPEASPTSAMVTEQLMTTVGSRRGVAAADALCRACVSLFKMDAAAISLVFDGTNTATLGASGDSARMYDELQFTLGEGPCLDTTTQHGPVTVADLADPAETRWPAYRLAMLEHRIRAVYAIPVTVAGDPIGALDLFRTNPGVLDGEQFASALLTAEHAQLPVLDLLATDFQAAAADPDSDAWAELTALHRAEVSQATGMLVAQLDIDPTEALVRLRAYAYANGHSATSVARAIVDRRLRLEAD